MWLVGALVCVVGQAGLRLVLAVSDDRPGSAGSGAGSAASPHPGIIRRASSSSCSCCGLRSAGLAGGPDLARRLSRAGGTGALPGSRALRMKARAWPVRQPDSGRVKLGQNLQGSIPSFWGANVASGLAVEAGLSLTAGLLEGQREDPLHGLGPAARGVRGGAGSVLAAELAGLGVAVRAVSWHWAVTLGGWLGGWLAGRGCRRSRGGHRRGQGRLSGVPVR
jgi:hypothetical protein